MTTPSTPASSSASGEVDGPCLADPCDDRVDRGGDRVGDDELVDAVEGGECVGVEGADPAEADESDAHQS